MVQKFHVYNDALGQSCNEHLSERTVGKIHPLERDGTTKVERESLRKNYGA